MRWMLFAFLLFWPSCTPPCTVIKATRCAGNIVEICGSNKRWQRLMDCSQMKPIKKDAPTEMVCAQKDAGCTCVPKGAK